MSEKIEHQAKLRLKSRLSRLQRLIELDAPVVILALQCELVGDLAKMFDPVGCFERERAEYTLGLRKRLDMCCEADCEESLVPQPTKASVLEDNPFLLDHCRKHADDCAAEVIESSDDPSNPDFYDPEEDEDV